MVVSSLANRAALRFSMTSFSSWYNRPEQLVDTVTRAFA